MTPVHPAPGRRLDIAVIGAGISGMSAAWLLSHNHDVTVYEAARRSGGHSNTIDAPQREGSAPVDMGFIVYNEANYPNLTALFGCLDVPTKPADMTFAVSLDGGRVEYAAKDLTALLARPSNYLSPRFWSMACDLVRFYRRAARDIRPTEHEHVTLGEFLDAGGYGEAFQQDHLLPQAAAIWSSSPKAIRDYPACAFVRFFENHGLMNFLSRPQWRTVDGGAKVYVERLTAPYADRIRTGAPVASVVRTEHGVLVRDRAGDARRYDQVVIAAHADQALEMLGDPSPEEREVLGAFRYTPNTAVLHTDPALMPRRRGMWSGWNYVGSSAGETPCSTTYWMNLLQGLKTDEPLFVTLNPHREPRPGSVLHVVHYEHPLFDAAALGAQRRLWSLQGARGTWFCGAHFGSGFHEDGLQAGLAVAEQLGGGRRPWTVAGESDRIHITAPAEPARHAA
jgi:predicted NAD/FAD-binding protein